MLNQKPLSLLLALFLSFSLLSCDDDKVKKIKVPDKSTHLKAKTKDASAKIPIKKPKKGDLPFSPKESFNAFTAMEAELDALLDRKELFPENFIKLVKYRRTLVRRYLKIHKLYTLKRNLEMPGVGGPAGKVRALTEDDLFAITLIYGKLLQEKMPSTLASIHYKVAWRDANGSKIYFSSENEENMINTALSFIAVNEQRRRLRKYMEAMVEGTMGTLNFVPGGTLAENTYVLVTGRSIKGKEVSTTSRVLSLAGIGLELLPVAGGVLKAKWIKSGKKAQHPLFNELNNVDSKLRQQLRGAERAGSKPWQIRVVKEDIMTRWIADYDRLMGLQSRSLNTSKSSVNKHGHPQPARGIDSYAVSKNPTTGTVGIVREYKRLKSFPGWIRSRLSLGKKKVNIPGLHTKNVACDQASWSWIIDRAIKAHKRAVSKGLTAEANASRDLLRRFVKDKLKRQVIIMTDDALIHTSRSQKLDTMLREAVNPKTGKSVTNADLKKAVVDYLAGATPQ